MLHMVVTITFFVDDDFLILQQDTLRVLPPTDSFLLSSGPLNAEDHLHLEYKEDQDGMI